MTLYALTDETLIPTTRFIETVEAALTGGAGMIQFREKTRPVEETLRLGLELVPLCRAYGVPLIVNDSIPLAQEIRADGVHLGRDDGTVLEARAALGKRAIIGVSCYNDLERAKETQREGADYVAFGSLFSSSTKSNLVPATIELIREARNILDIPICGIGGINADNVAQVVAAGADMIAVCAAIFDGRSVLERTRQLNNAMLQSALMSERTSSPVSSSSRS